MDSLITAAARALAAGDPLAALKRVALREDAAALALRGVAMAQLGDLERARDLLRRAARTFGSREPVARARCALAEAEIALVTREIGSSFQTLDRVRALLEARGDRANAAHAAYLAARYLLLVGKLDEAEKSLASVDIAFLPQASRAGHALVRAGIAMRRVRARPAREALDEARHAARASAIPAQIGEVERAAQLLDAPVARLASGGRERMVRLDEVEALFASGTMVVDACRNVVRAGSAIVPLQGRPVLFALCRKLAEAFPGEASREALLFAAFNARDADESHRARLRVEIGRLRKVLQPLAAVSATAKGFVLAPHAKSVAVLSPPVDGDHGEVLALLSDGEAWSSSALAQALGVSPRTVQRALEALAAHGKIESFGRGRACRWVATAVPGFPTSLLLPAPLPGG